MRKRIFIALCIIAQYFPATAQKPGTASKPDTASSVIVDPGGIPLPSHVFMLGRVVVSSSKPITSVISAQRLQNFARTDVAHALDMLPGVNLTAVGARSESMVYVRGFDLRQTPLLLDGIPIYVPYDGYVDLARFTTFDLAEVNVSKGYTSLLYGANAMGGAINLVSRKPVGPFEVSGATGWLSGGSPLGLPIRGRQGKDFFPDPGSPPHPDSFSFF